MRIRRDVSALTTAAGADWPEELTKYRDAVAAMRQLDPPGNGKPTDPLSWSFQAAIHGRNRPSGGPDTSNRFWSNCQHGSWFFLAWHRMYLSAFETIVQHFLGDDDWSLPYWYAIDPDDEDKAVLPPAFRENTPGNALFTEMRSVPANSGDPLAFVEPGIPALIEALGTPLFNTADGIQTFGGGERATPAYNGGEQGLLEGVPHGLVHVLVGNDYDAIGNPIRFGWMGNFGTAALDPIFWLHHSNIDRLWQVWLDADDTHRNPTGDTAWMRTKFSFPKPGGGTVTWEIGDVLDTTALGYKYENVKPPSGLEPPEPAGGGRLDLGLGEGEPIPPLPPQVIGATVDVPMVGDERVDVAMSQPADIGLGERAAAERLLLRLEGITGTIAAPAYDVYIDVPEGASPPDFPERRAGTLTTFGVPEASRGTDEHDGTGLNAVFDISSVRDALADAGQWDPANLRVSFVPLVPSTSNQAALDAIAARAAPVTPDLHAARIVVLVA
ncbi:tyrosinase family protein [Mycolicibacterium wolinskyi]|uniref:tyrosinase family protein n=1 Tax=Mycolicibacterium wolinskyi TaxID=59750 RepID=UPI0009FEA0FF|nr:tyrosinase family protein [Mycolicibacterium wolinskyi]